MKEYLKLTANLRSNITRLFISTTKPYKIASQDTLARWIKATLQPAGIDMSIFTCHCTRSASRVATRIPIDTVWKTGGWSNMRTFAKHCNKDIVFGKNFALF